MSMSKFTSLTAEFKKLEEATLALHRALNEDGRERRMTPEPVDEIAALHEAQSELVSAVVNSRIDDQRFNFERYVSRAVSETLKEFKRELLEAQSATRDLLANP